MPKRDFPSTKLQKKNGAFIFFCVFRHIKDKRKQNCATKSAQKIIRKDVSSLIISSEAFASAVSPYQVEQVMAKKKVKKKVKKKRKAKRKAAKKVKKIKKKPVKKKKKTKKESSENITALYGNGGDITFTINGETRAGHFDKAASQELVRLLNDYRAKHGKKKLAQTAPLAKAAMVRSKEIAVVFDHRRPNGKMCFSVAKELDGENIAGGYMSAQEIMDAWINSPPHNANMLYSKFKKIGISVFVLKSPLYGIDMYFAAQSFGY